MRPALQSPLAPVIAAALALGAAAAAPAHAEKPVPPERAVVGESVPVVLTPDLAQASRIGGLRVWTETVHLPGASFVKPHFAGLDLRAGDELIVRRGDGRVVEVLTGRGPKDRGSFWGLSVLGDVAVLELRFRGEYDRPPFRVDQAIAGDASLFEPAPDLFAPPPANLSVCAPADFEDVLCYEGDAGKWGNVLASVGVMSVGGNPNTALFCSGANVSPGNYVLTNDHCIASQAECDGSEFVFRYYRTGCNNGAPPTADWVGFRCDEIVASSPFGPCDPDLANLDFALCSVMGDPASTFGFATPDPAPLTSGEAIYIVQHPDGRPHEITHGEGADVEVDGTTLRYYDTLDTEPGSSGSPIFRESDDRLVGLHHCGGCSSPGVGNRGMLMSDIHPLIEPFLCTQEVALSGAGFTGLAEVSGNGNAVIEPGETWELVPRVRNTACDEAALAVTGELAVGAGSSPGVTVPAGAIAFGDVPAGSVAEALAPVAFEIGAGTACGGTVVLDLVDLAGTGTGPFPGTPGLLDERLGELVRTPVFSEDFAAGIPGTWTVIDGGTGGGVAGTWTSAPTGNTPGGLAAPYAMCDSDTLGSGQDMDEQLISPPLDATGFGQVELRFAHDFNHYSGGLDEKGDVDVRSSATGGAWVNVERFQGGDASGVVTVDVTAQAAADLELRFHYWDARFEWWWAVDDVEVLGNNGYVCTAPPVFADGFESGDTSAWSGSAP